MTALYKLHLKDVTNDHLSDDFYVAWYNHFCKEHPYPEDKELDAQFYQAAYNEVKSRGLTPEISESGRVILV